MIKMVVFDMAGTTVNEDNIVYKTVQKAINDAGFNVTLDQVLEEGAGKEKLQAIKSVLKTFAGNEDEQLADNIFQKFRVLLTNAYDTAEILPQNNAAELFSALKKRSIIVILNTGYNAATATSLITKLGWQKGVDFDGLITASDVANGRPDPAMILLAMQQFGIQYPKEVIKIGDSVIDIEEGQNAGCVLNIGITTGAHTPEQLKSANPDYIIDNLVELLPIIDKMSSFPRNM
ncbi:MAG: phosphonatase-like hydrolase [Bacteroidota bacterium]